MLNEVVTDEGVTELCNHLSRLAEENPDPSTAVKCLFRLASMWRPLWRLSALAALSSAPKGILFAEIPSDDFESMMRILISSVERRKEDKVEAACMKSELKAVLLAALKAAGKMGPLEGIRFFDHLVQYLQNHVPSEKKSEVCEDLKSMLRGIFSLLSRPEDNDCMKSLARLVNTTVDVETRQEKIQTAAERRRRDDTVPPFFSARLPEGMSQTHSGGRVENLTTLAEDLEKIDHKDSAKVRNGILRGTSVKYEAPMDTPSSQQEGTLLVSTRTTEENMRTIWEMASEGQPVLLIGSTGVGKTATLTELAARTGQPLVRINMSSNLGPEDFLARITLVDEKIVHELQPFARSFRDGVWVLLDEMNLAEESTLKVVTDAMETGKIVLCDQSSALSTTRVIHKHPDFCLFATQNPWKAGKRERMSSAFYSQFSVMNFRELPKEEWEMIVKQRLNERFPETREEAARLAKKMTDFHAEAREQIWTHSSETGAYATITNRELLMWTSMISTVGQLPFDEEFGNYARLIYYCRFRGQGRSIVKGILERAGMWSAGQSDSDAPDLQTIVKDYANIRNTDSVRCFDFDAFWKTHISDLHLKEDFRDNVEKCAGVHLEVRDKILSADFMQKYGVYTSFSEFWLVKWISDAIGPEDRPIESLSELGQLGAKIYGSSLRDQQARMEVVALFEEAFEIEETAVGTDDSIVPEMPVALTAQ